MGAFLSRNSVAPHHPLSVVVTRVIPQTSTTKKNKHFKFNTLVPQPQGPSQVLQGPTQATTTLATNESLTRADLRVRFLKAVKRGDIAQLDDLLRRYQESKLLYPEDEGDEDVEELVNVRGMWDSTPLISAVQYTHGETALWLLDHSADPHARNEKAVTALLLASLEGLLPVATRLLESSQSSEAQTIDKQIGVVYNSAADVNVRLSPLLAASMNGHIEILRLLLDHGAAVNQQVVTTVFAASTIINTSGGSTALQLAAQYGYVGAVSLLLQRKADCALLNGATNSSALLVACEHGHEECALVIFQAMTAKSQARHCGDTGTEKWQTANDQGYTPLHFAAANGLLDVCRALLSSLRMHQQNLEDEVMAVAFVNARAGARRESALLLAVRKRQHDVARLLLEAGADAELADRGGNTAAQVLARNKQDALLRLCEGKSQRQVPVVADVLDARPSKEAELRRAESHEGFLPTTAVCANGDER